MTDVMLEKGSLMVLSLDGKMAVDLSMVTGVREGDTVIVVRTDGTQEEGEVEAVSGNRCTVVLDDALAEYDETVTVSDSDGKELGSGTLYIHQPLERSNFKSVISVFTHMHKILKCRR